MRHLAVYNIHSNTLNTSTPQNPLIHCFYNLNIDEHNIANIWLCMQTLLHLWSILRRWIERYTALITHTIWIIMRWSAANIDDKKKAVSREYVRRKRNNISAELLMIFCSIVVNLITSQKIKFIFVNCAYPSLYFNFGFYSSTLIHNSRAYHIICSLLAFSAPFLASI